MKLWVYVNSKNYNNLYLISHKLGLHFVPHSTSYASRRIFNITTKMKDWLAIKKTHGWIQQLAGYLDGTAF